MCNCGYTDKDLDKMYLTHQYNKVYTDEQKLVALIMMDNAFLPNEITDFLDEYYNS